MNKGGSSTALLKDLSEAFHYIVHDFLISKIRGTWLLI